MIQRNLLAAILFAGLVPFVLGAEPAQSAKATNRTAVVEKIPATNSLPAASKTAPVTSSPVIPAKIADTNPPAAVATKPVDTNPPAATADVPEAVIIEYNNLELQTVLRTLATKAGVSLILGDNVTGTVTVHLEDVAYTNAMKLIAESKGYSYIEDKNYKHLVKIQSRVALEAEPVEMQLVVLRYSKAETLKTVLAPMLTAQGKILVDPRVNTLIISDVPSNLSKVQAMVKALDSQTLQVQIEAKFVERTRNPKKDIGVNWSQSMLNHNIGLRRPDPTTALKSNTIDPATGKTTVNNPSPLEFSKSLAGGPWSMPTTIFDAGEAQVMFSFLSQDTDTELLANPRVVTTDNGLAKITISTEYPIPQFQYNSTIGALQVSGFNYKNIGITLDVTPRINLDEFITLEVAPEASSQNGFASLGSGGGTSVQIPIVDTRNAQTTVLIKSGHTLAIGGMTRQDTSDSYSKVPLMGSIPGLGNLFRNKSLSKLKRDLYIFLTPTIIRANDVPVSSQAVTEPPNEPVYTNDRWMPHDTARPADLLPVRPSVPSPSSPIPVPSDLKTDTNAKVPAITPAAQNFGPQTP